MIAGASAVPNPANPTSNALNARDKDFNQASTLGMALYTEKDCKGTKSYQNPVVYGHDHEPGNITSYMLNRPLASDERLDFSTYATGAADNTIDKACRQFMGSVLPTAEAPPQAMKCANLPDGIANCFRVLHV